MPPTVNGHMREAPRKVNNAISVKRYLDSAQLCLQQADEYKQASQHEEVYVMLMRFTSLVLETIPKHQNFSKTDPTFQRYKRLASEKVRELEELKGRGYGGRTTVSTTRPAPHAQQISFSNLAQIDWSGSLQGKPAEVAAQRHANATSADPFDPFVGSPQLGVGSQQAQQSLSKQYPPSLLPTQPQLSIPSIAPLSSSAVLPPLTSAAAAQRHSIFGVPAAAAVGPSSAAQLPQQSLYPGVQKLELPQSKSAKDSFDEQLAQLSFAVPNAPALGPQAVEVHSVAPLDGPPPPGATCATCGPATHEMVPQSQSGTAEYKKLAALREVKVSVYLMEEFLRYAMKNTRNGIESCGILAGTLSSCDSVFTITTLIIPKQKGSDNTVEMINEEEVFDFQFERSLYPMGWIHTHPTQTCFMSSVDVHTQCGFQVMLAEAIGIVMAPTDPKNRCGIFRLSTPGGLNLVQSCPMRGFHSHPRTETGQEIYELCGHVFLDEQAKYEVVDLR